MSTKDAKEVKEPKEPKEPREPKEQREQKEQKEPKHRPDALRQPQRKDSLTTVLTYLQGRTVPLRPPTTASPSAAPSSPNSFTQASKQRRYSHGIDPKKKARTSSQTLRRNSITNLAGIKEEASAKTKSSKTPEGPAKTTKSSSTEKINKTADIRKKKSQSKLPAVNSEAKPQRYPPTPPVPKARKRDEDLKMLTNLMAPSSTPPPMPIKGILRVSSPDGQRPPPRHIRSYSASAATPGPGQLATIAGLSPLTPAPLEAAEPDTVSQPGSPIVRPLSPGATVRFAKATIHRVEVGPGRRFQPVKRRSKSTVTYLAPLDPVLPANTPKVTLQSPTKLRRHQQNQAAMGRYWMRMEEEEAQQRAEMERMAAEEAERYRAEPSSPPADVSVPFAFPIQRPETHGMSLAERLAAMDKIPLLSSLDKVESIAKSDAEDKLETVEADSDDSDAESDGGASTAMEDEAEEQDAGKPSIDVSAADALDGARLEPVDGPALEVLAKTGAAEAERLKAAGQEVGTTEGSKETKTNNGAQSGSTKESPAVPTSGPPAGPAAPTLGAEKPAPPTTATQTTPPAETPTVAAKPKSETTEGNAATATVPAQAQTAVSTTPPGGPILPATSQLEAPKSETAKAAPLNTTPTAPAATIPSAVKSEKPVAAEPRPTAPATTTVSVVVDAPKPVVDAPKPAVNTTKPAVDAPKPAVDTTEPPRPQQQRPSPFVSLRSSSPRSLSPRPMSPMTALRHKKTMATLHATLSTAPAPTAPFTTTTTTPAPATSHTHAHPHSPKLNHLQLSSSRRASSRPPSRAGEQQQQQHRQEIAV